VSQFNGGDVDRDAHGGQVCVLPSARLAAGLTQNPPPIVTMRSDSSAIGTNCAGASSPWCG
jgi:hypothetical protein